MRAAILAGGAASRFGGRPKGLERVGGERILDRVVAAVEQAVESAPLLVANAPNAPTWRDGLAVSRDIVTGCGSLGGIYTALRAAAGPVLVVAWDMPFVTPDLLRALVDGSEGYDVFLPESDGPLGLEPLCAVYGEACAEALRDRLAQEDLRATGFHDLVRVGTLPRDRLATLGDPEMLFFNVNTAADLERAQTIWRDRRAASR